MYDTDAQQTMREVCYRVSELGLFGAVETTNCISNHVSLFFELLCPE